MRDVHKFHKHFAHGGWRIPAANIWPRNHHLINRSVFFALLSDIPLQILHEIFIEQVLGIAHVQQLHHSAGNLAGLFVEKSQLNIVVLDVFVGKQIRPKCVVGWSCHKLLKTADVRGIGCEA